MQYGQLADRGTVKALQTRFSLSPDFTLNLSPEIAAVIPLEMPELLFQQGWRRFSRGFQVAGVAAQNSQARIGLQSTTNVILVLERVIITNNNAGNGNWTYNTGTAIGSTSLGTLVANTPAARDSRQAFALPMAETSLTNTAAPFTVSGTLLSTNGSVPIELPGAPWILTPGATLTVQAQTVNQAMDITFVWRERFLQDQENTQ